MKKVIPLLLLLMLFIACQPASNSSTDPVTAKREAVLSVIHSRKSVRHFEPNKTVSTEDVNALLRAAMAAPSGVNKQPWHFIVVTDRAMLDSLSTLPYAKMLPSASLAIVVCGDSTIKVGIKPGNISLWEYDCSLAAGNILLAAEAMGLGAVWTAVHPLPENINTVRRLLQLPTNIVPLTLIPIGYPTGEDKAIDKYKSERIHNNTW